MSFKKGMHYGAVNLLRSSGTGRLSGNSVAEAKSFILCLISSFS